MTGASQEPCKANWAASAETLNSNKPGSTCTSSWCKGEPQARLSDLGGALPMPSSQHHLPCKMGWCCLPPSYGPGNSRQELRPRGRSPELLWEDCGQGVWFPQEASTAS